MDLVGLVLETASLVAHRHYTVPFPTSKASLCAVVVGVVVIKRQRRTLVLVVGIDFEHASRHKRHCRQTISGVSVRWSTPIRCVDKPLTRT